MPAAPLYFFTAAKPRAHGSRPRSRRPLSLAGRAQEIVGEQLRIGLDRLKVHRVPVIRFELVVELVAAVQNPDGLGEYFVARADEKADFRLVALFLVHVEEPPDIDAAVGLRLHSVQGVRGAHAKADVLEYDVLEQARNQRVVAACNAVPVL